MIYKTTNTSVQLTPDPAKQYLVYDF